MYERDRITTVDLHSLVQAIWNRQESYRVQSFPVRREREVCRIRLLRSNKS